MIRILKFTVLAVLIWTSPLAHAAQGDDQLKEKIVGSWEETNGPVKSVATFHADGRYVGKSWEAASNTPIIEHADGTWRIEHRTLYKKVDSITPATIAVPEAEVVDTIVEISDDAMMLIDEAGRQYTKTKVNSTK